MADLQDIVDDLAARTGRAIDVEDRRFRLVAYSTHEGPVDDVRRDTILRRAATPVVVARLERLGVATATGPLRLPPAPELGMGARVCLPVRDATVLLGYVWVLDDPPLPEPVLAPLHDALPRIARALGALRDREDRTRAAEQEALAALLTAGDPGPAGALLAERGPARIAVAELGTDLSGLRRAAGARRALTGEHAGLAVALLVGGPAELDAGPGRLLGVGEPVPALADAATSHRQAVLALRVARAVPRFGPVAHAGALGPHGLLAPLAFPPDGSAPAPLPAALRTLAAAPDGPELLATLRAVLDRGDDVAGAAAALHVHRSTLHRRLQRVEALTGADLADGATRLELHAGLVLAELLGP